MSSLLIPSSSRIYNQLELSEEAEMTLFLLLERHKGHGCRTGAKVPPSRMFDISVAPHLMAAAAKLRSELGLQ